MRPAPKATTTDKFPRQQPACSPLSSPKSAASISPKSSTSPRGPKLHQWVTQHIIGPKSDPSTPPVTTSPSVPKAPYVSLATSPEQPTVLSTSPSNVELTLASHFNAADMSPIRRSISTPLLNEAQLGDENVGLAPFKQKRSMVRLILSAHTISSCSDNHRKYERICRHDESAFKTKLSML